MRLKQFLLSLALLTAPALAAPPDANYLFKFSNRAGFVADNITTYTITAGLASTVPIGNITAGCAGWSFSYDSEGLASETIALQSAPSAYNGVTVVAGSFGTFAGTGVLGSNPSTATTSSLYTATGYYPFTRIALTASSGTGSINISFSCWKSPAFISASAGGGGSITGGTCTLQVMTAINTSGVPTCNPVISTYVDSSICSNVACGQTAAAATALAANPANCAAGTFPLGIAASGAVENCTKLSQVFFTTAAPGSIAGNLPGDFVSDTTNHHFYGCNATSATAAPACTSVTANGWMQLDNVGGGYTGCTSDAANGVLCTGSFTGLSFIGSDTTHSPALYLQGTTSGGVAIGVPDIAGTAIVYMLPSTNGAAGQLLSDNGTATCGTFPAGVPATCHQLVWVTALANGTTATTQTVGDNTTKVATTAFVLANAGGGGGTGNAPYASLAAPAADASWANYPNAPTSHADSGSGTISTTYAIGGSSSMYGRVINASFASNTTKTISMVPFWHSANSDGSMGIQVTDSGSNISVCGIRNGTGAGHMSMETNTGATIVNDWSFGNFYLGPLFFQYIWTSSSSTLVCNFSMDGRSWFQVFSKPSLGYTPTAVGFYFNPQFGANEAKISLIGIQ